MVRLRTKGHGICLSFVEGKIILIITASWPHYYLGFAQPLTEMSTSDISDKCFLGNRVRPVREANNLTVICEPIV
jgi:hypothetical protein